MIVYLTLTLFAFLILIMVAGIRPKHSRISMFELERRTNLGDKRAEKALDRERSLIDVVSVQNTVTALLQVVVFSLSELTFGLWGGIVVAVFLAFGYGVSLNIGFLRKLAQKIYERVEDPILSVIKKNPRFFKILRIPPTGGHTYSLHIDSREELQHLVAESEGILTPDERRLIVNSLRFKHRTVRSAMTPSHLIDCVKKTEFLGPLTLDELHKKGHSRLPVVDGDINYVVGILHLRNLLNLDVKKSMTAEKAMEPRVYYIREDQTLHHALAAFLRTRHLLFIVVNKSRETVGLLTLEDTMEALLGTEIIDEYDSHDDLGKVTLRNLRIKNQPREFEDI